MLLSTRIMLARCCTRKSEERHLCLKDWSVNILDVCIFASQALELPPEICVAISISEMKTCVSCLLQIIDMQKTHFLPPAMLLCWDARVTSWWKQTTDCPFILVSQSLKGKPDCRCCWLTEDWIAIKAAIPQVQTLLKSENEEYVNVTVSKYRTITFTNKKSSETICMAHPKQGDTAVSSYRTLMQPRDWNCLVGKQLEVDGRGCNTRESSEEEESRQICGTADPHAQPLSSSTTRGSWLGKQQWAMKYRSLKKMDIIMTNLLIARRPGSRSRHNRTVATYSWNYMGIRTWYIMTCVWWRCYTFGFSM